MKLFGFLIDGLDQKSPLLICMSKCTVIRRLLVIFADRSGSNVLQGIAPPPPLPSSRRNRGPKTWKAFEALLSPSGDLGIGLVWDNHWTHFLVWLLKSSSNRTKLTVMGPQFFSGWYQMILDVFQWSQLFSDVFSWVVTFMDPPTVQTFFLRAPSIDHKYSIEILRCV